jgi:cobyrinic acid a,c-diamide synthase
MAQTFGALAYGLARFRTGLPFAGVLANHVGSARHAGLLESSLPSDIRWFGALMRDPEARLPERHLGLLQAAEIPDLLTRLDRLADQLATTSAADLPPPVSFAPPPKAPPLRLLAGMTVAIARDAAFGFVYPANLDTLHELGAETVFFSPLAQAPLPPCDALWMPGGYPELHAAALAANARLRADLRAHLAANKPFLAECGGMMALFDAITDREGERHPMAGLLPGEVVMQPRLAALGLQFAELPEGRLTGHTFHYSKCSTALQPLTCATRQDGSDGEAIYREGRLTASYVHFYFASNPEATARLLGATTAI